MYSTTVLYDLHERLKYSIRTAVIQIEHLHVDNLRVV